MTFPLFVNRRNRIVMGALCAVAFYFAYSIPNWNHLFEPIYLPMTWIDRAIPFAPWTVMIYMSEYFLFVAAYILFRSDLNRNKYLCAYFAELIIGGFFFVFFPTVYPRQDFPLPENLPWAIDRLFVLLRSLDHPSNCFPSMHVACCFLTAFAFLDKTETRGRFYFFFIWAALISWSTLPTKQHYFVDVLGGFVLSVVTYWIFYVKARYVPIEHMFEKWKSSFEKAN